MNTCISPKLKNTNFSSLITVFFLSKCLIKPIKNFFLSFTTEKKEEEPFFGFSILLFRFALFSYALQSKYSTKQKRKQKSNNRQFVQYKIFSFKITTDQTKITTKLLHLKNVHQFTTFYFSIFHIFLFRF